MTCAFFCLLGVRDGLSREAKTRRRRQRHGARPRPRAAVRDRARCLRRDDLQRRAAGELRPHHAVAGAVGRQVVRRDRDPWRRLVRQTRRHPVQGRQGHEDRPRGAHRHGRVRALALRPALAAAAGHRRLRQADRRHRLQPHHHPGARPRPAGRADLPRPRRRRGHAAGRQVARQCRGHRRRPSGPRSRRRPAGAGHGRHGRAPDADPDGAPARSRRRPSPAARHRGARHQGADAGQHQGDRGQRAASKASSSTTAHTCRPTWW